MNNMTGYKTMIGMVIVLIGQVCHALGARWPELVAIGTILIDLGSAVGAVGVAHRVTRARTGE